MTDDQPPAPPDKHDWLFRAAGLLIGIPIAYLLWRARCNSGSPWPWEW